jgi:hypothetical protein
VLKIEEYEHNYDGYYPLFEGGVICHDEMLQLQRSQ